MQVQINTDSNIEGVTALTQALESIVIDSLDRFSEHLPLVEVYLSDENSKEKGGAKDMRCLIKVRLVGQQPTVVSDQASTLEQAVQGAAEQMKRSLETIVGRMGNRG